MQSMNPCHRAEAVFGATAPFLLGSVKYFVFLKKMAPFW